MRYQIIYEVIQFILNVSNNMQVSVIRLISNRDGFMPTKLNLTEFMKQNNSIKKSNFSMNSYKEMMYKVFQKRETVEVVGTERYGTRW